MEIVSEHIMAVRPVKFHLKFCKTCVLRKSNKLFLLEFENWQQMYDLICLFDRLCDSWQLL